MNRPYFIWTPPFDNVSAGGAVLHSLAHYLKRVGAEVYVTALADQQNPKAEILPHITECPVDAFDCIAVYPEIFNDNPFYCGRVIRYMMHIPGYFGTPAEFDINEQRFVFSRFFNQRIGLKEDRVVNVPYLDLENFYDLGLPRDREYYYQGKGNLSQLPDAVNLGTGYDYNSAEGQQILAENLSRCKVLYCFDSVTAMMEIARLCGCPVVIIPDGFWTKEECLNHDTWALGGIGYGLEEKGQAIASINAQAMRDYYQIILPGAAEKSVRRMYEITQN